MAAIPCTASSSTNALFRMGKRAWNMSVAIEDKGLFCTAPSKHIRIQPPPCRKQVGKASTDLFGCVLGNFHYMGKTHKAYNQIYSMSAVVFTTLRDPAQFVLRQYTMKRTWDKQWMIEYPQKNLSDGEPAEWAAFAWWRHNLFTKMLATNTKLIWVSTELKVNPTKEESDHENAPGEDSAWLQAALDRLRRCRFLD